MTKYFALIGKQEIEQDSLVGIENAEGQQQSVDRARRADGGAVPATQHGVDQHVANAGADAAQEVIFQELARAPLRFERAAEHPEREHVHQQVPDAAVQEQIRRRVARW